MLQRVMLAILIVFSCAAHAAEQNLPLELQQEILINQASTIDDALQQIGKLKLADKKFNAFFNNNLDFQKRIIDTLVNKFYKESDIYILLLANESDQADELAKQQLGLLIAARLQAELWIKDMKPKLIDANLIWQVITGLAGRMYCPDNTVQCNNLNAIKTLMKYAQIPSDSFLSSQVYSRIADGLLGDNNLSKAYEYTDYFLSQGIPLNSHGYAGSLSTINDMFAMKSWIKTQESSLKQYFNYLIKKGAKINPLYERKMRLRGLLD